MNEGTINQLEEKLKKMLDQFDQVKTREKRPLPQSGQGDIIRRRAGEKEKRFAVSMKPITHPSTAS